MIISPSANVFTIIFMYSIMISSTRTLLRVSIREHPRRSTDVYVKFTRMCRSHRRGTHHLGKGW